MTRWTPTSKALTHEGPASRGTRPTKRTESPRGPRDLFHLPPRGAKPQEKEEGRGLALKEEGRRGGEPVEPLPLIEAPQETHDRPVERQGEPPAGGRLGLGAPDAQVDAVGDDRDLLPLRDDLLDVRADLGRDDGEALGEAVGRLGEEVDQSEPERAPDPLEARVLEGDPVHLEHEPEAQEP